MGKSKELAKNTVIIAFGKICTQMISFFLLPVYTALLSTHDYGIVDLLNTYIMLIIPIVSVQIDQGIFRFIITSSDKKSRKQNVMSGLVFSSVISILYSIFFVCIQFFWKSPYKWFLLTNVIASIFSNILLQVSRGLKDNITYAIASTIVGVSTVICNVIFIVFLHMGALGMFMAGLVGNCFCIIFLIVRKRLWEYVDIHAFSLSHTIEIIRYTAPLVPSSLSWWAIDASDRSIVSIFLGLSANGILSIAHKIPSVLTQVFNIFNIAWVEFVITHFNDEERDSLFTETINMVFSLFSSLCLCVIAFIPFVFTIIINKKFDKAYNQIPLLIIAVIFTMITNLYTSFYISQKQSKKIGSTAVLSAIIDIVIHCTLISFIGLYAATISSAFAYGVMMIIRYRDCTSIVEAKLKKKNVLITIVVTLVVVFIYYLENIYLKMMALILVIIYSIYINSNFLKIVWTSIIRKNRGRKL